MDDYFLNGKMTIGKRVVALGAGLVAFVLFLMTEPYVDGEIFATTKAYFSYCFGNSEPLKELKGSERKPASGKKQRRTRAEIAASGYRRKLLGPLVVAIIVVILALKAFGYL